MQSDDNILNLFYKLDDVFASKKNSVNIEDFANAWENIFNVVRPKLTEYVEYVHENRENPTVFLSFTTCKRLDLFKETLNSFIRHCSDVSLIDYWYCVDDNSSEEDRKEMKRLYPWIEYYDKSLSEKGHRKSMNLIYDKLKELKPIYWIHMEDDFLFHHKMPYIKAGIQGLKELSGLNVKQIVFNCNYAETVRHYWIKGEIYLSSSPNYTLHKYSKESILHYMNCHYWPNYSFRPSIVDVSTILNLGNFDSDNTFFEIDYANKWTNANYRTGFLNRITSRHIGRLTHERDDPTVLNAYKMNQEDQFCISNNKNVGKIYLINLDRRNDRLAYMKSNLIMTYERFSAIDGNILNEYSEFSDLLKVIDKKICIFGEIGCKLSHYAIWQKIKENTLILEDDVILTESSISRYEDMYNKLKNITSDWDIIYVGGQWTPDYGINTNCHMDVHKIRDTDLQEKFFHVCDNFYFRKNDNYDTFDSPLFRTAGAYIVSERGSKKLIELIDGNKDYFMNMALDMWLLQLEKEEKIKIFDYFPHIFYQGGFNLVKDECLLKTDIDRGDKKVFYFSENSQNELLKILEDNFVFINNFDHVGDDLYHNCSEKRVRLLEAALKDSKCVAVNTLGFFKSKADNLTSSPYFGFNDGIYIKKEHYNKPLSELKKVLKNIRIKMIGNFWNSSKDLIDEFNRMIPDRSYVYNNIEITDSNENIDFYIIINKPPNENVYYDPNKTLVFKMEPNAIESDFGSHAWGEWYKPDPSKFFYVNDPDKHLNLIQWRFDIPYETLSNKIEIPKKNGVSSILSYKNYFVGHKKRIEFLRHMENNGINMDIFGQENYHNFANYVGKLENDDSSNGLLQYKYYFMPENNSEKNYATEKICEPILCECLCFYWGCPNLEDYIDSRAFVRLPLDDFDESLKIVKQAIEEDWHAQRLPYILEAKEKFLRELGFFPRLEKIISNSKTVISDNNNKIFEDEKDSLIKIVNLERRKDRKEQTIDKLIEQGISSCEFIKAVDGKTVNPTKYIEHLFRKNDFSNIRGFIGCALSHYNLWKRLLKDEKNSYYLVIEDDVTFCENFKYKLDSLDYEFKEKDVIFFGYHMGKNLRENAKHIYNSNEDNINICPLNKELYIGGTFGYSINKIGAKKLVDYINANGIRHGIDFLMKIANGVDTYECQPQIAFSIWNEANITIDSDVQIYNDRLHFNSSDNEYLDKFVFYENVDQIGNDMNLENVNQSNMFKTAFENESCAGFNTLGFFKNKIIIEELVESNYFGKEDGIFIKKEYAIKKIKDENKSVKMTRVKLLCNWTTSENVCKEWSNMCEDEKTMVWKNIQLTWSNDPIEVDYYVIINKPFSEDDYYEPKRTIVFQMEPWVNDESKDWGVKTWGKWAQPNPGDFFKVNTHKTSLNNVQWQINLPSKEILEKVVKFNKVASICSNKNFDTGHLLRNNFIKYIDDLGIIDVYSKDNYNNIQSYAGPLLDDNKVNGLLQYKYYFMAENNSEKNYATEKIYEPILCECLCFYWGCPNLEDYIDSRAFVRLPLDDFDESLKIMKQAIEEDWHAQRLPYIRDAKSVILNELGFFPRLEKILFNEKYTAVIIEPRQHKALSFVLKNIALNLSNEWNIIIFHGNKNQEYVNEIIDQELKDDKNRIKLVNLYVDNLTSIEYNCLLTNISFYDYIPTETFLVFQTDTMIFKSNRHLINKFLQYDYVGAPWKNGDVGNGGFSLRKKSKMIEIIKNNTFNAAFNEDSFFSYILSDDVLENLTKPIKSRENVYKPDFETAKKFCIETFLSEEVFGCHSPWKHIDHDVLFSKYPEAKELFELNQN
jgi:GR25 family glycosyltransferase involved in LPS biosynthesis